MFFLFLLHESSNSVQHIQSNNIYLDQLIDTIKMGGEASKTNKTTNPLDQEKKIDHQMFKRYKYLPQQDWLQITIDVPEQKQMKLWENAVSSTTAGFEHRQNLLLPVKHEYTPKGWCGTIGTAKISYEYFPYIFSEELENRINTTNHFIEEELWYLLYCLVGCAKDFARSQRRIGDVRPHNIFISEQGQVKVACLLSWPFEKTAFEKTAYEKTLTYLAPQEMALLAKGNYQNKTNQVVAESFSIGLTLLAAGLLFQADEIYSVENRAIDFVKLKNKVNQWLNLQFQQEQTIVSYSPLLRNIVASLCTIEPEDREVSLDVEDLLRPYQDEILNLKPFNHDAVEFQPPTAKPQHQQQIIVNSQRPVSSIPQQRTLSIPSKNYVVSNVVDAKQLVSYGPPAEAYRQTLTQPTKTVQIGYGNVVELGGVQKNDGGYREVFNQYAANQPERPNQIVIPNQYYQPQFQKYSVINQQQPQTVQFVQQNLPPSQQTIQQTYSAPPANVITSPNFKSNAPINFQTTEFSSSPFFTSSNFQQSQYVTNSTVQYPVPIPSSSSSNNDFLRKIDEQLQNSRRLYPS